MRTLPTIALLAVLPMLFAGCSGGLSETSGLQQDGHGGGAVPPSAAGAKKRFDPFSDALETAQSPREVIKDPTIAQVMQPGPLPEMALGRTDAPVTIVKYASLTCPYCRKFQSDTFPQLKRRYIDTGKVRYILREFPIGFQSGAATIALRCAPRERYFDLYERFLKQQARWVSQEVRTEPIFEIAKQVGVTRAQYDACRQNQAIIDGLKAVKDRGRTLGIIGTPNFFVNGRLYKQVLTFSDIEGLIEGHLAGRTAAGPASQQAN